MTNKNKTIRFRCTEKMWKKITAICLVTGKTKTALIEGLINDEYKKNQKYDETYWGL